MAFNNDFHNVASSSVSYPRGPNNSSYWLPQPRPSYPSTLKLSGHVDTSLSIRRADEDDPADDKAGEGRYLMNSIPRGNRVAATVPAAVLAVRGGGKKEEEMREKNERHYQGSTVVVNLSASPPDRVQRQTDAAENYYYPVTGLGKENEGEEQDNHFYSPSSSSSPLAFDQMRRGERVRGGEGHGKEEGLSHSSPFKSAAADADRRLNNLLQGHVSQMIDRTSTTVVNHNESEKQNNRTSKGTTARNSEHFDRENTYTNINTGNNDKDYEYPYRVREGSIDSSPPSSNAPQSDDEGDMFSAALVRHAARSLGVDYLPSTGLLPNYKNTKRAAGSLPPFSSPSPSASPFRDGGALRTHLDAAKATRNILETHTDVNFTNKDLLPASFHRNANNDMAQRMLTDDPWMGQHFRINMSPDYRFLGGGDEGGADGDGGGGGASFVNVAELLSQIQLRERALGPTHLSVAALRLQLAEHHFHTAMASAHRGFEARDLPPTSAKATTATLVANATSETLQTALLVTSSASSRMRAAEEQFLKVIEIFSERFGGSVAPEIVPLYGKVGTFYMAGKAYEKAAEMFAKAKECADSCLREEKERREYEMVLNATMMEAEHANAASNTYYRNERGLISRQRHDPAAAAALASQKLRSVLGALRDADVPVLAAKRSEFRQDSDGDNNNNVGVDAEIIKRRHGTAGSGRGKAVQNETQLVANALIGTFVTDFNSNQRGRGLHDESTTTDRGDMERDLIDTAFERERRPSEMEKNGEDTATANTHMHGVTGGGEEAPNSKNEKEPLLTQNNPPLLRTTHGNLSSLVKGPVADVRRKTAAVLSKTEEIEDKGEDGGDIKLKGVLATTSTDIVTSTRQVLEEAMATARRLREKRLNQQQPGTNTNTAQASSSTGAPSQPITSSSNDLLAINKQHNGIRFQQGVDRKGDRPESDNNSGAPLYTYSQIRDNPRSRAPLILASPSPVRVRFQDDMSENVHNVVNSLAAAGFIAAPSADHHQHHDYNPNQKDDDGNLHPAQQHDNNNKNNLNDHNNNNNNASFGNQREPLLRHHHKGGDEGRTKDPNDSFFLTSEPHTLDADESIPATFYHYSSAKAPPPRPTTNTPLAIMRYQREPLSGATNPEPKSNNTYGNDASSRETSYAHHQQHQQQQLFATPSSNDLLSPSPSSVLNAEAITAQVAALISKHSATNNNNNNNNNNNTGNYKTDESVMLEIATLLMNQGQRR